MRIFKSVWFAKFAAKEGIGDEALKAAVDGIKSGLWDARLGGHVYKQRIARAGAGKSGGYRVILFFERHAFFVYGFAKSDRDNISNDELLDFKDGAKDAFALTEEQIEARLKIGTLIEIL